MKRPDHLRGHMAVAHRRDTEAGERAAAVSVRNDVARIGHTDAKAEPVAGIQLHRRIVRHRADEIRHEICVASGGIGVEMA
jgi:hypothetical protein